MTDQRVKDRFWGVVVGVPMVAIPIRIAEWSPVVGVTLILASIAIGLAFIFGVIPYWFLNKLASNKGADE